MYRAIFREDDDEYEDESEDESGDERSDDYDDDDDDSGEWVFESDEEEPEWERRVSPLPEGNGRTMELTRLLEECRVMNEGQDDCTDPSNIDDRRIRLVLGRVPVCFLTSKYFCIHRS